VRDWVQVKHDGKIILASAEEALKSHNIDSMGLDNVDRKVLSIINDSFGGGPVGIDAIAASLNEERDTIVDIVEPFLLKIGFLKRTPRGRELTKRALEHMGFVQSAREKEKELF
jgi:Holliday junction DNA helicase RuvB